MLTDTLPPSAKLLRRRRIGGVTMLLVATALWGSMFIAVQAGQKTLRPSALNFWRFVVATIALAPFLRLNKKLWLAAGELSIWLFLSYATQAIGRPANPLDRLGISVDRTAGMCRAFAHRPGRQRPRRSVEFGVRHRLRVLYRATGTLRRPIQNP